MESDFLRGRRPSTSSTGAVSKKGLHHIQLESSALACNGGMARQVNRHAHVPRLSRLGKLPIAGPDERRLHTMTLPTLSDCLFVNCSGQLYAGTEMSTIVELTHIQTNYTDRRGTFYSAEDDFKTTDMNRKHWDTAIVALCVVAAAWAAPQGGYNYQAPVVQQPEYPSVPAQYSFQWDVNDQYSGNYYGHQEQRDGANTHGSYYVRLPDTRLMRVEYYVDEYGFHPVITYEGEAQYPSAPAQVYSQPAPAPTQVYSQPAPSNVYSQPAPAPTQVYSQPTPAPQPTYQQPTPTPSQLYSQPGK
ncbi:uncharacterized protein LOC134768460 [Penaeus indicus]|uniref:uncharacterized protein LOC134768460 n=1 Tax=Penaeus indicus TaxID=29960 RepID=UPI00300CF66E